jgi:hypothetical protein
MSNFRGDNVRRTYTQQVLSGWSGVNQSGDTNSDSTKTVTSSAEPPLEFWQQGEYLLLIPIIIKPAGVSDNEHKYQVRIANDLDLSLAAHKPKSKRIARQIFSLAKEKSKDKNWLSVVYGISDTERRHSLSYPDDTPVAEGIAHVYSRVLGHITRTIQLLVHHTDNWSELQKAIENERQRYSEAPTSENLGEYSSTGRGKKVRTKVLPQRKTETSTGVDEAHRKVLGE